MSRDDSGAHVVCVSMISSIFYFSFHQIEVRLGNLMIGSPHTQDVKCTCITSTLWTEYSASKHNGSRSLQLPIKMLVLKQCFLSFCVMHSYYCTDEDVHRDSSVQRWAQYISESHLVRILGQRDTTQTVRNNNSMCSSMSATAVSYPNTNM